MIDHLPPVKKLTRSIGPPVSLTKILPLLLIALLAGCKVSGPAPTPTPPTTPTEPVTPPTTLTPPTTPDEPATPPSILPEDFPEPFPTTPPVPQPDAPIPYLGDWIWVAQAQDGSVRTGYFSVTQAGKILGPPLVGGEGGYLLCYTSDCEGVLEQPILRGITVLGTYTGSDGSGRLTAAFGSFDRGYLELAAFDDGRMGTEVQGRESFVGTGAYYTGPERQGETPVVVTIGRLTDAPMIPFDRNVTATVKALTERASERAAMMDWDVIGHDSPRESRDRP